ncbi:MAG: hypothetical protein WBQ73_02055 [Candidatus Babeliales bacterium]
MKTQWLVLFVLVAFNTSIKGGRYNGCVGGVQGLTFKPAQIILGDDVDKLEKAICSIHGYDFGRRLIENTDIVGCFLGKMYSLRMYPMVVAHCYLQLLEKESKGNAIDAYQDKGYQGEKELFWQYIVGIIRVITTEEQKGDDCAEVNQSLTIESAKQLQVGFSFDRERVEQEICFIYGDNLGKRLIENTNIIDCFLGKKYSLLNYPYMFAQWFVKLIEEDGRNIAMNAAADMDNEYQVLEDYNKMVEEYYWHYVKGMKRFFEIVMSEKK